MSPAQSVNKTECHEGLGTTTRMQTARPGPGGLTVQWSQEGLRSQTGSIMPSRGHRSCREIAAGILGLGLERGVLGEHFR